MAKHDELLLKAILDLPNGTILNLVQAAAELPGNLEERFGRAYYELTNKDPGAETDWIGLKDE